eukprot:TRINITY_DN3954_c0_g2_i6.p1 TRINITY_DN3954_c0_g2~~TRINITY_DN3954_c0_g2_i6.p1  ORF type:complete len:145 (-),score=12.66 TRINITY_DN3954_c0_g2_i6:127-561(-)
MKRNDLKKIGSFNHRSFDRNSQTAFFIQDERGLCTSSHMGYFHPLETRTLSDLYSRIYSVVGIGAEEQDAVRIVFKVNNEAVEIHYPSELIGSDGIVAIITNNESPNVLSDSIETDKLKYIEEHSNRVPQHSGHAHDVSIVLFL